MTDSTSKLRPYIPRSYPTIKGGEASWTAEEMQRISAALSQAIAALKDIDARLQAAGI